MQTKSVSTLHGFQMVFSNISVCTMPLVPHWILNAFTAMLVLEAQVVLLDIVTDETETAGLKTRGQKTTPHFRNLMIDGNSDQKKHKKSQIMSCPTKESINISIITYP